MKPCGPIAAACAGRCLSHQRPLHRVAKWLPIDRDTEDHSLRHCPAPRLRPPLQRPQQLVRIDAWVFRLRTLE